MLMYLSRGKMKIAENSIKYTYPQYPHKTYNGVWQIIGAVSQIKSTTIQIFIFMLLWCIGAYILYYIKSIRCDYSILQLYARKRNKKFNLFKNYNSDIQLTVKDVIYMKYISNTLKFHDAKYTAKHVILT